MIMGLQCCVSSLCHGVLAFFLGHALQRAVQSEFVRTYSVSCALIGDCIFFGWVFGPACASGDTFLLAVFCRAAKYGHTQVANALLSRGCQTLVFEFKDCLTPTHWSASPPFSHGVCCCIRDVHTLAPPFPTFERRSVSHCD